MLFDATKAETAGNADWIIDGATQQIPSPSITGITTNSTESYWKGGISAWGVALAKLRNTGQLTLPGNGIETLVSSGAITYGSAANAQDLSNYQVFVVCEPNSPFTAAEKTAILNFVKNGGGLFMIADHNGSDRNNDGWDSLEVWNDLMTNNSVQLNPFGFRFNANTVTPTNVTVDAAATNMLTHGLGGNVTTLAFSAGATMTINNFSVACPAVWNTSKTTDVMALYGTFGAGRFVAVGDSSVVDDGTGTSGKTLYDGWSGPVDNGYLAINGTVWLVNGSSNALAPPVVVTSAASAVTTNAATLNGTINPNGQTATAWFEYGLTTAYGTNILLSGTYTGATAQALSTNLSGLTAGTTYHFRLTATNKSGTVSGADQVFTTAALPTPDLTITKTHTAVFNQGATNLTYTITVTNLGTLGTTGTVSVVDTLPTGLTATALTGDGWTLNLGTLTSTRSDSLAAGAGYPPITITVTAATNAPGSVTNRATVSGGGDVITANNTAADPTTIYPSGSGGTFTGILAGWDVSGLTSFGVSPLAPVTNAPNLSITGLTRGGGVTNTSTAAARAWGGNGFDSTNAAQAITSNEVATCALAAYPGYRVSYSSITRLDYRRSNSGPAYGLLQFQVGSGPFLDLTNLNYSSSANSGASLGPFDLSGIAALQNVGAGTNVTFRIVNWGATSSGGTWYIFDVATSTAPDFAIQGTIAPVLTPAEAWRLQWFGTTNDTGTAADTYVATSDGMPNLLKYALGLNPLTVSTNPVIGNFDSGYLRLSLPKNATATDLIFTVEATGDLLTPAWTTNGTTVEQNTANRLQVRDNAPLGSAPRRFMRLHVTRP